MIPSISVSLAKSSEILFAIDCKTHYWFIKICGEPSAHLYGMVRSTVSKSSLKAELFPWFMCTFLVFRYIFSAFTTSSVLAIRRILLMWSSPLSFSRDEQCLLKDETCLLLLWVTSLVTRYTFAFTHIASLVKPVHISMAMAKSRFSKDI